MTLIINAATPAFIVHASDRLLTKRVGGRLHVHSDVENKTLIVRNQDAICVIGYTGAAYIGDVITDEWIACTITDMNLAGDLMISQPGVRRLFLNTLLCRIEDGLRSITLPGNSNYLGITVSGVRQRGRYTWPFIREFERNRGVVRSYGYMRPARSPAFHLLSQMGDPVPTSQLQRAIGRQFRELGISAEAFRRGMVNTIREKSKISKTVGDEVMTVTIECGSEGWAVTWTFVSDRGRLGAVVDADGRVQHAFSAHFSPWIISPAGVMKPSQGNGHLEHESQGVRIRCGNQPETPQQNSSGNLFLAVSSQPRAPSS